MAVSNIISRRASFLVLASLFGENIIGVFVVQVLVRSKSTVFIGSLNFFTGHAVMENAAYLCVSMNSTIHMHISDGNKCNSYHNGNFHC
jgi:hypothetical protein